MALTITSAKLSPTTAYIGDNVIVEVSITESGSYFFTADGYALKTSDGGYFEQKEDA
jgi:hypothetical protein